MNCLFPLQHADEISQLITDLIRCYTMPAHITDRLRVLLECNDRFNLSHVANKLGRSVTFVRKWRAKAQDFLEQWPSHDGPDKAQWLCDKLADAPRSGTPPTYTAEHFCRLLAIALQAPTEHGREMTHWTQQELADEVNKQLKTTKMSKSTVGRVLSDADIRPHKIRYWLNPKIDDEEQHRLEVRQVCETYEQAPELRTAEGVMTISIDEKTGIQALERIAPNKPVRPGMIEAREFEYHRHGTLCLTPCFDVVDGTIVNYKIAQTRNEQDFVELIEDTVAQHPESEWVFVADQLNVHKSESLVRYIAQQCGIDADLGIKGKEGILKTMQSRMDFLTDKNHRIRFVFTPKHCSWLNQVEIWFGILSRKLLNRGNFSSIGDLRLKMERFIDYFNEYLAKPYKWTYKGKPLQA